MEVEPAEGHYAIGVNLCQLLECDGGHVVSPMPQLAMLPRSAPLRQYRWSTRKSTISGTIVTRPTDDEQGEDQGVAARPGPAAPRCRGHRQRVEAVLGEDDEGEEVVVPDPDDADEQHGDEPGHHERQGEPGRRCGPRPAPSIRAASMQLLRDRGVDEGPHQVHPDRADHAREDHPPDRVDEPRPSRRRGRAAR